MSTLVHDALAARVGRLSAMLEHEELDGLLVSELSTKYWLGCPQAELLLVTGGVVHPISRGASQEWPVPRHRHQRLGYEAGLPTVTFLHIQHFSHAWKACSGVVRTARRIKDDIEVVLLRQAAQITTTAIESAWSGHRAGLRESDVLGRYVRAQTELGGQYEQAFDPSVGSGPTSSAVWSGATGRVIEAGDAIVVDCGAKFRGYCADVSRSFFAVDDSVASSSRAEWDAAHEFLNQLLVELVGHTRPGVPVESLARLARTQIREAGYPAMDHLLGHGVGLETHEFPVVHEEGDETMEEGMVVALEPSVRTRSGMGLRIEEVVLVTDGAAEVLSRPRDAEDVE